MEANPPLWTDSRTLPTGWADDGPHGYALLFAGTTGPGDGFTVAEGTLLFSLTGVGDRALLVYGRPLLPGDTDPWSISWTNGSPAPGGLYLTGLVVAQDPITVAAAVSANLGAAGSATLDTAGNASDGNLALAVSLGFGTSGFGEGVSEPSDALTFPRLFEATTVATPGAVQHALVGVYKVLDTDRPSITYEAGDIGMLAVLLTAGTSDNNGRPLRILVDGVWETVICMTRVPVSNVFGAGGLVVVYYTDGETPTFVRQETESGGTGVTLKVQPGIGESAVDLVTVPLDEFGDVPGDSVQAAGSPRLFRRFSGGWVLIAEAVIQVGDGGSGASIVAVLNEDFTLRDYVTVRRDALFAIGDYVYAHDAVDTRLDPEDLWTEVEVGFYKVFDLTGATITDAGMTFTASVPLGSQAESLNNDWNPGVPTLISGRAGLTFGSWTDPTFVDQYGGPTAYGTPDGASLVLNTLPVRLTPPDPEYFAGLGWTRIDADNRFDWVQDGFAVTVTVDPVTGDWTFANEFEVTVPPDRYIVAVNAASGLLLFGEAGPESVTIYKSTDGGTTLTAVFEFPYGNVSMADDGAGTVTYVYQRADATWDVGQFTY